MSCIMALRGDEGGEGEGVGEKPDPCLPQSEG